MITIKWNITKRSLFIEGIKCKIEKIETNIDLTSRDIFRSSVYYLHQNDIVYIEPSKIKINSTRPIAVYGSIAVSGLSLLVSIFNIITSNYGENRLKI